MSIKIDLNLIAASAVSLTLLSSPGWADTVIMKDGSEVKGLVVEQHETQIVISTFEGEKTIKRDEYVEIDFDDPAYSLYYLGKEMESQKKYGAALSYYEKAHALNSELRDAREAAIGIRSRFWSEFASGPKGEMTKQQEIQSAFRANAAIDSIEEEGRKESVKLLWDRSGLKLGESGDWIKVVATRIGGQARKKGVKPSDKLLKVDGKSLRYLNTDTVTMEFLEPRYSTLALTFLRSIQFPEQKSRKKSKNFGFTLTQGYEGIVVKSVKEGSVASDLGIREGDMIFEVNGESTRYMSTRKLDRFIRDHSKELQMTIQRTIQLARK